MILSNEQFGKMVKRIRIRLPESFIMGIVLVLLIILTYVYIFHYIDPDDRSYVGLLGFMLCFIVFIFPECSMIDVYEKGISIPEVNQTVFTLGSRTVLEFSTIMKIIVNNERIELIRSNDRYVIEKNWMSEKNYYKMKLFFTSKFDDSRVSVM